MPQDLLGWWMKKAILITPNDIQLFKNKTDALHNRDEIARLKLAE